jgi:hypothetical protein
MSWLFPLHATHLAALAIGNLALVCLAGMSLGSVKVCIAESAKEIWQAEAHSISEVNSA